MPDLPDLLEKFLASRMESRSFSRSTAESYARDLKAFAGAMEAQGIGDPGRVKPHHIAAYLAGLKAEGKAPASVARAASSIRAFFRYLAADLNEIEADPAAHIRPPKPERKAPRILTEAETARLLGDAGRRRSFRSARPGNAGAAVRDRHPRGRADRAGR